MRWRIWTLAVCAVVMSASPATAKEGFPSTLSGPGITAPRGIELPPSPLIRDAGGDGGAVAELDTGTAQVLRNGLPDHLGPRYMITFPWETSKTRSGKFVQYLYPYASGGPVIHIPGGQNLFGDRNMRDATSFRIDGSPADAFRWLGYREPASAAALLPASAAETGLRSTPVVGLGPTDDGAGLMWAGLIAGAVVFASLASAALYRRRSPRAVA